MNKIETNVIKPIVNMTVDSTEYRLIDEDVESLLDGNISEVKSYIDENHGKGKSAEEKDNLYLESQKIWKKYTSSLDGAKYNFYLNKDQWKFITDLVLHKLEYDVNTVFFAIELRDLFDVMKSSKYSGNEYLPFKVNATEVTYIYHLISKHKVKGLTKDSYLFSEILLLIGNISKIFNYYDTTGKNLAADIQDWVATFEDGVEFESRKQVEEEL
jgi:hypothetical protein